MSQIAAAENLIIEMEDDHWRLFINGQDPASAYLFQAVHGQALRYGARFATTRRLPATGALPLEDVQRVVVGWSANDESWHLGLVLEPRLAAERGSRWCEIAHWPDPDTNVFSDLAVQAGKTLSTLVNRPFNVVPPRPAAPPPPPPPPPPLPDLPLTLGLWKLYWDDQQPHTGARPLRLMRASSWTFSRLTRVGWYTFWVAVYLVLSIATLTRTLALPNSGTMLPNPDLLPYLGIIAAVVLVGVIFFTLYELFAKPDTIIIDPQTRTVTAQRWNTIRWEIAPEEVQSLYVTQVVSKKANKIQIKHGEINLYLGGTTFHALLLQDTPEEISPAQEILSPDRELVVSLDTAPVSTPLQAAGLYIARVLGIPCWYDQRAK